MNKKVFFPLGGVQADEASGVITLLEWIEANGIKIELSSSMEKTFELPQGLIMPNGAKPPEKKATILFFYGSLPDQERFFSVFGFHYSKPELQKCINYCFEEVLYPETKGVVNV